MNNKLALVLLITSILWMGQSHESKVEDHHDLTQVYFLTADGIHVYGDLLTLDKKAPTILLFHQGGSNARAEYSPIIEKLREKEVNLFAIDQRSGGQLYGSYNRTIYHLDPYQSFPMCDAYKDLTATLHYLKENGFEGPFILWGSSYSGSLAIKLAYENQESVAGVLAFSPASGGPMAECRPDPYFEDLNVPLLVFRPAGEMEIGSVQEQARLVEEKGHQVYVADPGTHGSSMLVESRVEGDLSEHWRVVNDFLEHILAH